MCRRIVRFIKGLLIWRILSIENKANKLIKISKYPQRSYRRKIAKKIVLMLHLGEIGAMMPRMRDLGRSSIIIDNPIKPKSLSTQNI